MKRNNYLKCLTVVFCAVLVLLLASCGQKSESASLRTQLDTPTDLSFDWEAGTMSFTAVENATYYRVYFFNVTEPSDALGNADYFRFETTEEEEVYPDGQTGIRTVTVYEQDESGNYVTLPRDEILSMTPTFSKRYAATYLDENEDKQSYAPGDTVTFSLPNDSVGGGKYYIAVKAGGPIALYTLSEYLVTEEPIAAIMHNVDPEISLDYSNTFNQYGTSVSEASGMMGASNEIDADNEVLDGNGMMFEIANAETFYNADANIQLTYHITDDSGQDVPFSFTNVRMKRNDSNTFCGWELVDRGEDVTTGTASVSHYIYSHSGPTMEYQTSGFFYINGLTEGESYTLCILAPGDDGKTSYDSGETAFEFIYEVTDWNTATASSSGEMASSEMNDISRDEPAADNSDTSAGASEEPADAGSSNEMSADSASGEASGAETAQFVGGWTAAESTEITDELTAVFGEATSGLAGVDYTPVAYLGSQVVAGINHCFLCRSAGEYPNTEASYALVYVYEDLNGNAEILRINDLDLSA